MTPDDEKFLKEATCVVKEMGIALSKEECFRLLSLLDSAQKENEQTKTNIKTHFEVHGQEWPQSGDIDVAINRLLGEHSELKEDIQDKDLALAAAAFFILDSVFSMSKIAFMPFGIYKDYLVGQEVTWKLPFFLLGSNAIKRLFCCLP